MKLSELNTTLRTATSLEMRLPNGSLVPSHYHITEAGYTTKHFIDCGGKVRTQNEFHLQLWTSVDTDHRLNTHKLIGIIEKAQKFVGTEDLDVVVEYQTDTLGIYGLEHNGTTFQLEPKRTDCLAKENCGIPNTAEPANDKEAAKRCCTPGGGCC